MTKKTCLITMDEDGKIVVKFSGENYTHKNLKDIRRALTVEFRQHHYRITHKKESVGV